jgi:hypothetical protein
MLLNLRDEDHQYFRSEAEKRGQTLNGLIKMILWEWKQRETVKHDARHTG